jgi:DNA-binding NarL/FixJ family response regulator
MWTAMDDERPVRDDSIRVVLVDDHELVSQAVAGWLRDRPGIAVVGTATSADGARRLVRELVPDVVLMDYRLPDGTGTAAARQILEERPHTRVVLLTASDDEQVVTEAIDAGCAGFVRKSGGIDELVGAVQAAHAGTSVFPSELLGHALDRLRRGDRPHASGLTPREVEVLVLLAEGLATRVMAERLGVTVHTMRNYVQSVIQKLDAHSKLEAVAAARRQGLLPTPPS